MAGVCGCDHSICGSDAGGVVPYAIYCISMSATASHGKPRGFDRSGPSKLKGGVENGAKSPAGPEGGVAA